MADSNDPLANFYARERERELERERDLRAAHAEKRVSRGLLPTADDGEPGTECSLYPTPEFLSAKPGQEWRILDALPLGTSRIGWLPDLPADVPWPAVEGRKLPFLAQIDLACLPPSAAALMPGQGRLYLFGRCDNDHWPHALAAFVAAGPADTLVRAGRPPDDELWPDWLGEVVYDGVPLTPQVPDASSAGRQRVSRAGWLFGLSEEFGSPGQIADRNFLDGDDWINLLTIRSVGSMKWSDCGELYIIVRRSDLLAGNLGQVFATVGSG